MKYNRIFKNNIKGGRRAGIKGTKNKWDKQEANSNMVDLNPNISVITLNGNRLNSPDKRKILSNWT